MIRYTTPTIDIEIENDLDLSTFTERHVTFSQVGVMIDVEPQVIGTNILRVELSQLETAGFKREYAAQVQVNLKTDSGRRYASEIMPLHVTDNLLKKVLE